MAQNKFDKLRASAERGNKQAMYDLAVAYKNGNGTKKNAERFFEWMRKAALADFPDAMIDVAWAYEDGEGSDPDVRLFFEWLKKAAEKSGDPEAIFNLALAYKDGKGTEKNDGLFFEWMKKAAEKNHREAMYHLALAYDEGTGTDQDSGKYFEWTEKLADIGEPGAMLRLAEAYKNGKGTSTNDREYYKWTRMAVNAAKKATREVKEEEGKEEEEKRKELAFEDLPTAMFNLAIAYRDARGTKRHIGRHFVWLKKAAEAADATTQKERAKLEELKLENISTPMFELALAYKDGIVTRRSLKLYFYWMKRAATVGLPAAMVELACAFKDSENTNRSRSQYCDWMERAAKAENSEGMYRIALAYGSGVGRRYDTKRFLYWVKKAVEENHPEAFIAQRIAELQEMKLLGKTFMPFFEKLLKLHAEVRDIQQTHILKEEDEDVSGVVAHYTVLPALYSMLPEKPGQDRKTNRLRLYNIAYVNDPREGRRLLSPDKKTTQPLKNSEFLFEFFPPGSEKAPEHPIPWEGQKFSVYVGSFALVSDRLDLWRAYGSNGLGYSIVTPLSAFNQDPKVARINLMQSDLQSDLSDDQAQIFTNTKPTLYRVHYGTIQAEKTLARLAGILKEIKDAKNEIIKGASGLSDRDLSNLKAGKELIDRNRLSANDLSNLKAGNDLIDSIVRAIVSGILYLYKDDEYENEKEARIIMGCDITYKGLRLEVNNEHDPPRIYVETEAFLFESEKSLIIIGPKVVEKTAVYLNLQKRLAVNNLLQTQVKMSEIKYR